ncbi:hypothetical protein [Micromonospora sp. DH14]|uniref:hypothetical protein n=1 Tax=Micromonospora sp. DH14 TaxID=3040120 RepID=UPI0024414A1A|nr:hypothetical protein [Micromonospora sp. DH14]MDG9676790.1 hypothetical protein [Micromonospora sp. DH14]
MDVDVTVPAGTKLFLLAGEWFCEPTVLARRDEVVIVVAIRPGAISGQVWVTGHVCRRQDPPECGTGACFEHHVLASAIRLNLSGQR